MAGESGEFKVVLDTLKGFEACRDSRAVQALILSSLARFGYQHVSMMAAETKLNRKSTVDRTLLSSWPKAWFERYHAQKFIDDDPVAAMSRRSVHAFRWSDARAITTRAQYIMTAARDEHRLRYGLCVPICNLEGFYAAASFAGEDVDQSDSGRFCAELIAVYAFNRLSRLNDDKSRASLLTDRQREIMKWVAAGKTAWDTSIILNISVNTVNKTITNAMERLDVRTRAQAIAEAIRRGEIAP